MGQYRDGLLWAAFDLQSRIYNILHGFGVDRHAGGKGFLQAFLVEGTEPQANYVKRNTAYVFAEYLGWVEILRRDVRFLDLGNSEKNLETIRLLSNVSQTLNEARSSDSECFRIFRGDQRAIGELMIDPDSQPGERRCIGYAAYCSALAAGSPLAEWSQAFLDDIELVAREPSSAQNRLTELHGRLIDLIEFLDTGNRRFPPEQRSRFTPGR